MIPITYPSNESSPNHYSFISDTTEMEQQISTYKEDLDRLHAQLSKEKQKLVTLQQKRKQLDLKINETFLDIHENNSIKLNLFSIAIQQYQIIQDLMYKILNFPFLGNLHGMEIHQTCALSLNIQIQVYEHIRFYAEQDAELQHRSFEHTLLKIANEEQLEKAELDRNQTIQSIFQKHNQIFSIYQCIEEHKNFLESLHFITPPSEP